jgi:hypothetical protein
MPSAPRLNLSGRAPARPPMQPDQRRAGTGRPAGRLAGRGAQAVMARTEDVGERFAEEARRIHYGETEHRGIRGQATPEQREALRDEGIETFALPMPAAVKEPLQ